MYNISPSNLHLNIYWFGMQLRGKWRKWHDTLWMMCSLVFAKTCHDIFYWCVSCALHAYWIILQVWHSTYFILSILRKTFLIIIFLDMYIMLVRVSTPLVIYNYICSYMEFRMVCVASSSCSSTLVELVLVSIDTDFLPKNAERCSFPFIQNWDLKWLMKLF